MLEGCERASYLVRNYFLGLVKELRSRSRSFAIPARRTKEFLLYERASHHTGGGRTHARARPTSLGGRPDARLSAAAGDPRGGVSPPGSPSRADRESARADFPRMHARFLWGSAAASGALVVASGSDSRAWRATIRRWERSSRTPSRTLVEMSSSAKLLTIETKSVLLNESHAEALAEAGIENKVARVQDW